MILRYLSVFVVLLVSMKSPALGLPASRVGDAKTMRCIERERRALLEFKRGLKDDYGHLSSWGSTEDKKDCCKWRGVGCSNRHGHVIALDLHGPGFNQDPRPLRGKVSTSLLDLQHLSYLDLSFNNFGHSQIPNIIGSLGRLRYLNFANANFFGIVPHHLGNLTNLEFLDLSGNYGLDFGNLDWLSHLSLLRHLDLSWVEFSNEINWVGAIIYKLPRLKHLNLGRCDLPDVIPPLRPLINSSFSLEFVDLSFGNLSSLSSSIYSWLFNSSTTLIEVSLQGCQLKGPIPDAFGNMLSLAHLDLSENELEGGIPQSFGNLSHLRSLELYLNNLTEQLPEFFHKLSGLENSLQRLNLRGNQLRGSLPDFTRFSSLTELHLDNNQLNGSFPNSFQLLPSLLYLDFSWNQITGSLPYLAVFPSLIWLDVGHNHLNGTVTESIGQLSKLEHLVASLNSLEGLISDAHFSNLSNLQYLDLSLNSLALNFSSDWVPPFQLETIKLSSCKLGPRFPKWFQTQHHFSELDISVANISDTVPDWFWDLSPKLESLNLSYNQIDGMLPDLSLKFPNYPGIDLSSNRFRGPIPLVPPNVTSLNLSKNIFSGSISFLCAIVGLSLSYLDLSDNQLSGELPNCWMHLESLTVINLSGNNFSGNIPSSMGFLYQMESLQLHNNNFTGELPSPLKKCSQLRIMDMGGNKLTGNIPEWIGTDLPGLIVLSLRSNEFYGSIPPNICHLDHVQILDLSGNNISGNIPDCLNNLTALVQKNNSGATIDFAYTAYDGSFYNGGPYVGNTLVQWKGQESEYRKILGLLKIIDLSSNKLVGKIPQEIAGLKGLVSLNLSRNDLTGNIIEKIGLMEMLESLDLSKNQLFGEIPRGLASLNFLSVLDLSNNNLSGKIPTSTQLQSFNASAYAGNNQLCGLPLPNKCPGDETTVVPPATYQSKDNNIQEDDDTFITPGFYVSLGLGFILGFWGVFGTILLNSSLRYAYFKFLDNIKDWRSK